ncbi:MAG: hypothetical protein ABIG64_04490 [Candidatus Omnitrophota bacterium]
MFNSMRKKYLGNRMFFLEFIILSLFIVSFSGCNFSKASYNNIPLGIDENLLKTQYPNLKEIDPLEFETKKDNIQFDKILIEKSRNNDIEREYYFISNTKLFGIFVLYANSINWEKIVKDFTAKYGQAGVQANMGVNGAAMVWQANDATITLMRSGQTQTKVKLPSGHQKMTEANQIMLIFWPGVKNIDYRLKKLIFIILFFSLVGLGLAVYNITVKKSQEFLAKYSQLDSKNSFDEFKKIIAWQMYVFFPVLIFLTTPLILLIYVFVQGILTFNNDFIVLIIFISVYVYVFKKSKRYKQLEDKLKNIQVQPDLLKQKDRLINTWLHKPFPDW